MVNMKYFATFTPHKEENDRHHVCVCVGGGALILSHLLKLVVCTCSVIRSQTMMRNIIGKYCIHSLVFDCSNRLVPLFILFPTTN